MKKTFLKAALFSMMIGVIPATTLTGCKDYDSDIDNLTQRDDEMQKEFNDKLAQQQAALNSQITALQDALNQAKQDLAAAKEAATQAANAANAAKAAADKAQQTGDAAAAAAAKAQADAQAANAEAKAAAAAAAQAKIDAINEATKQVANLRNEITSQINDLKKAYGDQYTELSAAVAKAATKEELSQAVATLQAAIEASKLTKAQVEAMLSEYISQINANTQSISALSGRIDGIDSTINSLKTDLTDVKTKVATNTDNISKNEQAIAANAILISENTAAINEIVKTAIPGLEEKINALDIKIVAQASALATFKTQAETQLATLNTFMNTYKELLEGLSDKLGDIDQKISKINTDLETIIDTILQISDLTAEIEATIDDLKLKMTQVQNDIVKINAALSTLNQINAKRLTSITLVPTAYVGGIPTIEFYSASYLPMGALDEETGFYAPAAEDAKAIIVTNNDTKALYRMNPSGVALDDIVPDEVTFVQQTATSRAAAGNVIKVVSVAKNEDGILEVTTTKADGVTNTIDNAGEGKIYTVALKVPVAPKNYFTWTDAEGNEVKEAKEDAVVYSEYSRISESTFKPEIAWNKAEAPVSHFWGQDLWALNDAAPVAEVSYLSSEKEPFDLTTLVTACMNDGDNHKLMTAEQVASFGFSFEYSVAKQAYEVNGINQQIYAEVSTDGKLVAVQPEGQPQASRVGKTPIISVVMKQGENVVDQRFFKIKYVIDAKATTFTLNVLDKTLSCDPFNVIVTWDDFIKNVLDELPFEMNKEEFLSNYQLDPTSVTYPEGANAPVNIDLNAEKDVIIWAFGLDNIGNLNGKDKDYEQQMVFKSALFPDITVVLKGTIHWPSVLPVLGDTFPAYWNNGVMQILPIAMPQNFTAGDETATYNTNVLTGRIAPYMLNLLDCARWDVQINGVEVAAEGFKPAADELPVTDGTTGYEVVKGEEKAAYLWYEATDHTPFCLEGPNGEGEDAISAMNFFIENNPEGIELVENEGTINLGWYIALNGRIGENTYSLYGTKLQIIKPLKSVNAGTIDPLTQSSTVQYRELSEGMTFTDCFNEVFDNDSTVNYYMYYDIKEVVYGNVEGSDYQIYVTSVSNENKKYNPADLNMEPLVDAKTGKLQFTGAGIALQEDMYLNVPITVTHKWGVLRSYIKVLIKKSNELN